MTAKTAATAVLASIVLGMSGGCATQSTLTCQDRPSPAAFGEVPQGLVAGDALGVELHLAAGVRGG